MVRRINVKDIFFVYKGQLVELERTMSTRLRMSEIFDLLDDIHEYYSKQIEYLKAQGEETSDDELSPLSKAEHNLWLTEHFISELKKQPYECSDKEASYIVETSLLF